MMLHFIHVINKTNIFCQIISSLLYAKSMKLVSFQSRSIKDVLSPAVRAGALG